MTAPIEEQLLIRFTGQKEVRDVVQAQALLLSARDQHAAAQAEVSAARWAVAWAALRLSPVRMGVPAWILSLVTASLVGLLAALFLGLVIGCGVIAAVLTMVVLFLVIGGAMLFVLGDAPGETDDNRSAVRNQTLRHARERLAKVRSAADAARRDWERYHALVQGLRQALDYPLHRLLSTDWDAMSGEQFERFLVDVFAFLGYRVTHCGHSGDQGADLILELGELRIAVQAKCYSGSVGNAAVQEVFAAKAHYQCHRCVVITNSSFTAAARDLAASTGCLLIEGHQLPDLIRGKIRLS